MKTWKILILLLFVVWISLFLVNEKFLYIIMLELILLLIILKYIIYKLK